MGSISMILRVRVPDTLKCICLPHTVSAVLLSVCLSEAIN